MYTMHVNVHFSRRKTLIYILDEHEEVRWTGTSYAKALDYLLDNGQSQFKLEGNEPGESYIVNTVKA